MSRIAPHLLRRVLAVAGKEMRLALSYRLSFAMNVAGVFLGAAMFHFLSEMIGSAASGRLAAYGGSYFPFVLIGVAFQSYLKLSMDSMASSLRNEQLLGTLEAVTATPTSLTAFAAGSALWQFAFATYRVFMYLFFGAVFFGLDLAGMNILTALVVLVLSVAAFAGMGVISGSFILVYKQGDPVRWVYGSAALLLGGVYYPLSVLPAWLRPLSVIFPITHSLEAMRQAVINGATISDVSTQLLILLGFAVVSIPLAVVSFRWALRRIRRDGTAGLH